MAVIRWGDQVNIWGREKKGKGGCEIDIDGIWEVAWTEWGEKRLDSVNWNVLSSGVGADMQVDGLFWKIEGVYCLISPIPRFFTPGLPLSNIFSFKKSPHNGHTPTSTSPSTSTPFFFFYIKELFNFHSQNCTIFSSLTTIPICWLLTIWNCPHFLHLSTPI